MPGKVSRRVAWDHSPDESNNASTSDDDDPFYPPVVTRAKGTWSAEEDARLVR